MFKERFQIFGVALLMSRFRVPLNLFFKASLSVKCVIISDFEIEADLNLGMAYLVYKPV